MRTATLIIAAVVGINLLLSPLAAAGERGEPARYENFRFRMPEGWRSKDVVEGDGRYRVLVPADYPPDAWLNVRLYPTESPVVGGTLSDFVAAKIEALRAAHGNAALDGPIVVTRQGGTGGVAVAHQTAAVRTDVKGVPQATWFTVHAFDLGERYELLYVVHASMDTYRQHARTIDALVDGVRFASTTVLATGEPPLTQLVVDDAADFMEWLVDVPFDAKQRDWVRGQLLGEWQRNDRKDIDGTLSLVQWRAAVAAMPEARRAYVREQLQAEAIAGWRKDPADKQGQVLLKIYDSGQQTLAAGDPPLTRRVTDASLEAMYFMASQVESRSVEPTREQKDAWAKALAGQYATLPVEQQQAMAQMPMLWAGLRFAWPDAKDAERAALKAHFAKSEPVQQIIATFPAKKGLSDGEFYAEMQKLNRQHEAYTFMSNLSHTYHNANMMMIYNMGGTGWQYRR